MNMTTNAQVYAALANAAYKSIHTGEKVDEGIKRALEIDDYIDTYMRPHYQVFTGDYERQTLGDFYQHIWLQSIVINCVTPFSKSVDKYHYWIELVDGTDNNRVTRLIDEIPHELMKEEGCSVEFEIRNWLPPRATVDICAESTNAFGRLDIKLVIT